MLKGQIITQLRQSVEGKQEKVFESAILLIWLKNEIEERIDDLVAFRNVLAHSAELLLPETQETFNQRLKAEIDLLDLESFFKGTSGNGKSRSVEFGEDAVKGNLIRIYELLESPYVSYELLYRVIVHYEVTKDEDLRKLRNAIVHPGDKDVDSLTGMVRGIDWQSKLSLLLDQDERIEVYVSLREQEIEIVDLIAVLKAALPDALTECIAFSARKPWQALPVDEKLRVLSDSFKSQERKIRDVKSQLLERFYENVVASLRRGEILTEGEVDAVLKADFVWEVWLLDLEVDMKSLLAFFKVSGYRGDKIEEIEKLLIRAAELRLDELGEKTLEMFANSFGKKKRRQLFMKIMSCNEINRKEDKVVRQIIESPSGVPILLAVTAQVTGEDRQTLIDILVEYPIFYHPSVDLSHVVKTLSAIRKKAIASMENRMLAGLIGAKNLFLKDGSKIINLTKVQQYLVDGHGYLSLMHKAEGLLESRPLARLMHLCARCAFGQEVIAPLILHILQNRMPEPLRHDMAELDVAKTLVVIEKKGRGQKRKWLYFPSHLLIVVEALEGLVEENRLTLFTLYNAALTTYMSDPDLYHKYLSEVYNVDTINSIWSTYVRHYHPKSLEKSHVGIGSFSGITLNMFPEAIRKAHQALKLSCHTDLPTYFTAGVVLGHTNMMDHVFRHYMWSMQLIRLHGAEIYTLIEELKDVEVIEIKNIFNVLFNMYVEELDNLLAVGLDASRVYHAYGRVITCALKTFGLEAHKDYLAPLPGNLVCFAADLSHFPKVEKSDLQSKFMQYRRKVADSIGKIKEHMGEMRAMVFGITKLSRGQYWVDNPEALARKDCEMRGLHYLGDVPVVEIPDSVIEAADQMIRRQERFG